MRPSKIDAAKHSRAIFSLLVKRLRLTEFTYAAKTWKHSRRVIAKAEFNRLGPNNRFIVTNLEENGQYFYEEVYCARGDMENRIKEQQLDLFADRTSCHDFVANQFRLLLSSLAYILLER